MSNALHRTGGPEGNERLTSTVGLALIVLLGAEAATTLSLSAVLSVHIFLGLLLLPAVSLKLASVGWRAFRYYAGDASYRLLGPPQIAMRLPSPRSRRRRKPFPTILWRRSILDSRWYWWANPPSANGSASARSPPWTSASPCATRCPP